MMGAKITGAGTDSIKIQGVEELKGDCTYSVVPDQIEAGTFMLAAVATRGDITIKNCITKHLELVTAKIEEMGAEVEEIDGDTLRVVMNKRPNKISISWFPNRFATTNGSCDGTCKWYKYDNRKYLGFKISIYRRTKQNGCKDYGSRKSGCF